MTIHKIFLGGNRSGLGNVPFSAMLPSDLTIPTATPPLVGPTVAVDYASHKYAHSFQVNRYLDFTASSPVLGATSQALWTWYTTKRASLVATDDLEIVMIHPKTKIVQITVDVITPVVGLTFDVGLAVGGAIASLNAINGSVAGFTASSILNTMVTVEDRVSINLATIDATAKLDGLKVNIIVELMDFNHVSAW